MTVHNRVTENCEFERRRILVTIGTALFSGVAGCSGDGQSTDTVLSMSSDAVPAGGMIPTAFTCDGADVSPPLSVRAVPDTAVSLGVMVDDPDAGEEPFTHWVIWGLPPDIGSLPRNVPRTERVPDLGGAIQGQNDFGSIGYRGPCPPVDDGAHTYRFRVYAFSEALDLAPGATAEAFNSALSGLLVGTGGFLADYDR